MSRNYEDLKPIISQFRKVLVTGPHGAGNKITANIIAEDFGLPWLTCAPKQRSSFPCSVFSLHGVSYDMANRLLLLFIAISF